MVNPKTRKQLFIAALAFIVLFTHLLQTVKAQSIGIGTTTPNVSARVDIQATDKGLLIPRMTSFQRTSILNPATGLLVYDTDVQAFFYWIGLDWKQIPVTTNVWLISGNSGSVPAINYVGTSDNIPLLFRTFNQRVGYLGTHMGDLNVFWGYQSGINNSSGHSNIAIGAKALATNTITSNLVAIGDSALANNTGYRNTAIGSKAMFSNTIGVANTAIGNSALNANSTGNDNTASGANALVSNTTGFNNTADGSAALTQNLTGSSNTAIGRESLLSNIDGIHNTGIGYGVLSSNSHGSHNTAIGSFALYITTTGNDNSALGYNAVAGNANHSNATAIGANAIANCDNCMVLGSINGFNGGTSDVNVGIGTPTPSSKLDVNGKTTTDQLQVGTGTVMSNIQSGTLTVGPSASGSITVTLTFPTAFASPPKVIATVRGSNFNDTFAATTRSISITQAVFNIQRVDINGSWSQNLQLDWIAIQ